MDATQLLLYVSAFTLFFPPGPQRTMSVFTLIFLPGSQRIVSVFTPIFLST